MSMDYQTVIGLEIHAELVTESKMYCECENRFGGEINDRICPVCVGLPGALPTVNKKAVELAVRTGTAFHCTINNFFRMARKNYFYPDLPKGYQISQGDTPICSGGYLEFMCGGKLKRVNITRIHLEEDAGKMLTDEKGSVCDFNRCGVPLIEIVTEPDLNSAEEVSDFLKQVRLNLLYLDVCDGKMAEGSLRCDVNVSVHRVNEPLGERCELKNISGFSAAVRAVKYESERQLDLLEREIRINRETRRWDDEKGESFLMRSKENEADYRYFDEPDMPEIYLSNEEIEEIQRTMPELLESKRARFFETGLSENDINSLLESKERCGLFEAVSAFEKVNKKTACNFILSEIARLTNSGVNLSETLLTPERLSEIILLIQEKAVSSSGARTLLMKSLDNPLEIRQLAEECQLIQVSDDDLIEAVVTEVLAENEKSVADYKNGKTNALAFLIGRCMKKTRGKINPEKCSDKLVEKLR